MPSINLNNKSHSDLTGKILVATKDMPSESLFNKAVVFIVSHTKHGTFGIQVNNPVDQIQCSIILNALNKKNIDIKKQIPVYMGGPVEATRGFILHTSDYAKNPLFTLDNGMALSSSVEILQDIAKGVGPMRSLFVIGFAGWAGGQIEQEIINNSWFIAPFSEKIIFEGKDDDKWSQALKIIGFKNHFLHMQVGHS